MKGHIVTIGIGLSLILSGLPVDALEMDRVGVIEELQVDSQARAGSSNVAWIRMTGTWAGVSCNADWAWFNSKDDAHLLASALAAKAQGVQVRVYVDDALPKTSGYCHVSAIRLQP